jgi:hypothetical protein
VCCSLLVVVVVGLDVCSYFFQGYSAPRFCHSTWAHDAAHPNSAQKANV